MIIIRKRAATQVRPYAYNQQKRLLLFYSTIIPTFGYDRCSRYTNSQLQHEPYQRQEYQAGDTGA